MSKEPRSPEPFAIKDCSLLAIATGITVENLKEMRDSLLTVHPGSIYHHFWGALMRARFDEPEYSNDFAGWVYHALGDNTLAERLAVIDPTDFDLESLRQHLIDIIEQRLDEIQRPAWASPDKAFHFIRSQLVVFDTRRRIAKPKDFADVVPQMSLGSIFYHFIDARRRNEQGEDDFRVWVARFGATHAAVLSELALIDPYFNSIRELREKLAEIFQDCYRRPSA
jgi:hypothetical protein